MTFLLWEFPRLPPVLHMPFMVIGLVIAAAVIIGMIQWIGDQWPGD